MKLEEEDLEELEPLLESDLLLLLELDLLLLDYLAEDFLDLAGDSDLDSALIVSSCDISICYCFFIDFLLGSKGLFKFLTCFKVKFLRQFIAGRRLNTVIILFSESFIIVSL